MAGKSQLAINANTFGAGRHARERNPRLHAVLRNAIEPPKKVQVPPGAAELSVGDRLKTDLLLLFDDPLDFPLLVTTHTSPLE